MLRHRHELLDIFVYRNLRTKLYYKRDDFNFPIVNFPLRCSNIPAAPAHIPPNNPELVVPISISLMESCLCQRNYWTKCSSVKLKSSLRKFYGRHHDMVDRYGISVSQMTTDMYHLS